MGIIYSFGAGIEVELLELWINTTDGRNCISRLYGEWSAEDIREVKGGDYI